MKLNKPSSIAFFFLVSALAMIATHIAGKATRDAIFLSYFDVSFLPKMLIVSSIAAVVAVLFMGRWIARRGPHLVVPLAFVASAGLFLLERHFIESRPEVVAVVLYLHLASFGAVLISGFWSVINESFDPHSAKKYIGTIAGGATVGGLLGGVLTERVAAMGEYSMMLPVLASLHLLSGLLLLVNFSSRSSQQRAETSTLGFREDYKAVAKSSYLRKVALLILLLASSGAIIDYMMKQEVVARFGTGDELLRFFAIFYTGTGLFSLLVQFGLTKWFLQRFGNAGAVGLVPAVLTAGGISALFFPGFLAVLITRGTEMILRNSIYRSGYELLYAPVSENEKRSGKLVIDVGVERLADGFGGALTTVVIYLVAESFASSVLAVLVAGMGFWGFWVSRRLFRGYVDQLESNLSRRAGTFGEKSDDWNHLQLIETIGEMKLDLNQYLDTQALPRSLLPEKENAKKEFTEKVYEASEQDPVGAEVLQGEDAEAIYRWLGRKPGSVEESIQGPLIELLAWDMVYREVIVFLQARIGQVEDRLLKHLLNSEEDFVIRRRISRILQVSSSQHVVQGLLESLADRRFEVRYQSSAALQSISRAHSELNFSKEEVFAAISREFQKPREAWNERKLIDELEIAVSAESEFSAEEEEYIISQAGRGIDYVFRLLSVIFPEKTVMTCYHGLFTDDQMLRGTALEYLDSVLPSSIKESLWPLLDKEYIRSASKKSHHEIQQELIMTQPSIQANLRQLLGSREQDEHR